MSPRSPARMLVILAVVVLMVSACAAGKTLATVASERAGNLSTLKLTRWVPVSATEADVLGSQAVRARIAPLLSRLSKLDTAEAATFTQDACEVYALVQAGRSPEDLATYLRDKGRSSWVYVQRAQALASDFATESRRDFAGILAVAAVCEAADQTV